MQKGFAKAGQASCKLARRDRRALEVGQTRSYKLERDIRTLSGVLRCENIFRDNRGPAGNGHGQRRGMRL